MTLHYRLNAKFGPPENIEGLVVNDGDVFEQCNFAQGVATGMIFGAKKNLVFVECNLANCVYHPTTRVKQCQVGNYDFCVHDYPNIGLAQEVDNCRHVTNIDNSDPENIIYTRETIFLGRRSDVNMTDEETITALAPYDSIRRQLQLKPKWVTNG